MLLFVHFYLSILYQRFEVRGLVLHHQENSLLLEYDVNQLGGKDVTLHFGQLLQDLHLSHNLSKRVRIGICVVNTLDSHQFLSFSVPSFHYYPEATLSDEAQKFILN